jgi:uncharacterized membrane protein YkvA (DUF1232 family)
MAKSGLPIMSVIRQWKRRVQQLKVETYALYLACRDPRTPWYAKLLAAGVVAYAVSPIDLIPDFIPVLGVLDDLVIVPLGTLLAIKMVPKEVMVECREKARNAMEPSASKRTRCLVAATVVAIWCLLAALVILLAFKTAGL